VFDDRPQLSDLLTDGTREVIGDRRQSRYTFGQFVTALSDCIDGPDNISHVAITEGTTEP
jgi:hypothetical protein